MIKAPLKNKGEITALRTMHSKTFDMGGGRRICAISQGLAHAPSDLAKYNSKQTFNWNDPNIVITKTANGYRVRGGWFKANVNATNIAVTYTSRSGTKLRMRLDKIGGVVPSAPSKITVSNGYITWHDVAPDVDIQLQFRPARMEWFKRMKSATAARQFDWTIQEDNNNTDKFDFNSKGHDNENRIGKGVQRTFKATTKTQAIKNVKGITTTRFRETWDGSVMVVAKNTRIKTKAFDPVYPVLLDAAVSVDISTTNDDGHQGGYGYWQETGNSYTNIVWNSNYPTSYRPAFRFQNVLIAQGATINTASIDFVKQRNYTANISADFYGENVDNAPAWAANQGGSLVSSLAKTTAKTTESGTQWGYTGALSVDIKTIVQEIVNRAGWASGNAMRIACPNPIGGTSGGQFIDDYSKAGTPSVAQLNIDYTAASGTTLTVQDISQSQALDNINLTQANNLTVNNTTQSQSLDSVVLGVNGTLSINDLSQPQSLEQINLIQQQILTVAALAQAQALDNVSLAQSNNLTLSDLSQSQTLDNIILETGITLSVAGLSQLQSLEQITLTQQSILTILDLLQTQQIDNLDLTQSHALIVDDIGQAHLLDACNVFDDTTTFGYVKAAISIKPAFDAAINIEVALKGAITIDRNQ